MSKSMPHFDKFRAERKAANDKAGTNDKMYSDGYLILRAKYRHYRYAAQKPSLLWDEYTQDSEGLDEYPMYITLIHIDDDKWCIRHNPDGISSCYRIYHIDTDTIASPRVRDVEGVLDKAIARQLASLDAD